MISMIQKKTILIFILLLPGINLAKTDEPPLAFRDIWLGESLSKVQPKIAKEFEQPEKVVHFDDTSLSIVTGNNEGVRRGNCPVAAPPSRIVNCLYVSMAFWLDNNEKRLNIISVQQSFRAPIRLDDFVYKLQKSYGPPRLSFSGESLKRESYDDVNDNLALVWGGLKNPKPPYRPGFLSSIYLDYERIGGRYITVEIYNKKGLVSGYSLQIVDSDRMLRAFSERNMLNTPPKQHENLDPVRF